MQLHITHDTLPAAGATVEVAPGVRWLRMPLPFALDHINLWLLADGDAWTAVDTGIALDPVRDAWRQVLAGYPLVRQARAMVRDGALGRIRVVRAEFAHGGHVTAVERDSPGTAWRYDPATAGPSGVLADAGSHPLHMIPWIIGQDAAEISARFYRVVPGRVLEDNAFLTLRYEGGAVGTLWASAVALGHRTPDRQQ